MRVSVILLLCLLPVGALAQAPAQPAAGAAGAPAGQGGAPATLPTPAPKPEQSWRDTSNYVFQSVARTTEDLQHVAYALTLREYCSNRKIPDDFVKERLARFSAMTGREESCRTLMDY